MSRVLYYPIMNKKEVKMKKEEFILEGKPEQKLEIVCLICSSLLIILFSLQREKADRRPGI